jgi:hypothetical protein
MTNVLRQALTCDDLDESCRLIQDALGITDGGVAAQAFSGRTNWAELTIEGRAELLRDYLIAELAYAL